MGARASSREILLAIIGYETAAESPENVQARWKLARALYFRGSYTGLDAEARRAVFERARVVSEQAIGILARRASRKSGRKFEDLSIGERASAVADDSDAAPTFFWAAVSWGEWALSVGKTSAAKTGAAEKIRDYALIVIALDPRFEEGGGYRILGRLHDQTPWIPFLTGWVSRREALRNLKLAMEIDPRNFVNRRFLAEALAKGSAAERAEALRLARDLVADAPSPGHLVEELTIQEAVRRDLTEWTR